MSPSKQEAVLQKLLDLRGEFRGFEKMDLRAAYCFDAPFTGKYDATRLLAFVVGKGIDPDLSNGAMVSGGNDVRQAYLELFRLFDRAGLLLSNHPELLQAKSYSSIVNAGHPEDVSAWFLVTGPRLSQLKENPVGGNRYWIDDVGSASAAAINDLLTELERGMLSVQKKKPSENHPHTSKQSMRLLIISALVNHHRPTHFGCEITESIPGVREFSKEHHFSSASLSSFLKKEFGGFKEYQALCLRETRKLSVQLQVLDGTLPTKEFFDHLQELKQKIEGAED